MTTNIIPINKFDILFKKIMYTVLTISICKYINFIPTFVDNLIILLATLYLIYLLPQFPFKLTWDKAPLRIVFVFFVIWNLVTMLRGFSNFTFNKFTLINEQLFYIWILPLFACLKLNKYRIHILFRICIILCYFSILYTIINIPNILTYKNLYLINETDDTQFIQDLQSIAQNPTFIILPITIFFIANRLISKRYINLMNISLILAFFSVVICARRTTIFYIISLVCFSIINKRRNLTKSVYATTFIIIVVSTIIYIFSDSLLQFFPVLAERAVEDSRSGVINNFYADFTSIQDWLIGRGSFGTYYDPIFDYGSNNGQRYLSECGYLTILLRGGLLLLIPYYLIGLSAIKYGITKSNNFLVRAMAFYILAFLLFTIVGVNWTFKLHYIIYWLCIGGCFNRDLRNMSNVSLYKIINYGSSI